MVRRLLTACGPPSRICGMGRIRMSTSKVAVPVLIGIFLALMGSVAFATALYDFKLIAKTGDAGLVNIQDGVSINDNGQVAFAGDLSGGVGIFVGNGDGSPTNISPGFGTDATRRLGRYVQINNFGQVLAIDRTVTSPIVTLLRTWNVDAPGSFTTIVRGHSNCGILDTCPRFIGGFLYTYNTILASPSLNNEGQVAFIALSGSNATNIVLSTPALSGFHEILYGSTALLRPMIDDGGRVLVRGTPGGTTLPADPILLFQNDLTGPILIAGSGSGFSGTSRSPGISDDGVAVAFNGDRGDGAGIFLVIPSAPELGVIRVAGEGLPDLGYTLSAKHFSTPIKLTFDATSVDSRVGVIHYEGGAAGIEGDTFIVTFLGTPTDELLAPDPSKDATVPAVLFRKSVGLWTRRIDIRARPAKAGGGLEAVLGALVPVIQVGDTVPGDDSATVAAVSFYDPIAKFAPSDHQSAELQAGAHQLAFWISAGSKQYVMRATRGSSVLLDSFGLSQAGQWAADKYDSHPVCTLQKKGCFLTMLSMQHNYFMNRMMNETGHADAAFLVTPYETNQFFVDADKFTGGGSDYISALTCPHVGDATFSTDEAPDISMSDYPTLNEAASSLFGVVANLKYKDDDVPRTGTLPTSSTTLTIPDAPGQPHKFLVDSLAKEGIPVGLKVSHVGGGTHYLLAVGISNGRVIVADPGCYSRQYLDQVVSSCGLSSYTSFSIRGRVVDPSDLSRLVVKVPADGEAILGLNGQQTGIVGGVTFIDLPRSSTFTDSTTDPDNGQANGRPLQSISIDNPDVGDYTLDIRSVTGRPFSFRVEITDATGHSSVSQRTTVSVPVGETISYHISIGAVAVPNVVGLTQAAATSAITGAGLVLGTVTTQASSTVPAGNVISQNPSAGTSVAAGSAVNLVVSSGAGCATDISSLVQVTRSGFGYNVSTQRFVQTLTVRNISTSVIDGPISLVLDSLSSNASLFNMTGTTVCAAPAGSPFINLAGDLNPGASGSVTLQFTNPTRAGITYATRVLGGSAER
jgi:PASTA domain